MERNMDYLTAATAEQLQPYQIDSLNRTICDYIHQNKESRSIVWKRCLKCGSIVDKFSKGGYTFETVVNDNGKKEKKRNKPMLKCPSCHHRFVVDHGQLT